MSTYFLNPKVRSYIFNYIRDNHIFCNHVPKSATYSTIGLNYEDMYDKVDDVLKRITKNLEQKGAAAYVFASWEMHSGRSQILRLPSKYIKKFERYDDNGEVIVDFYNKVFVGKAVDLTEEELTLVPEVENE